MNVNQKNTIIYLMIVTLWSVFFTSFPVNAAKYEAEEELILEGFKLNEDFMLDNDFLSTDVIESTPSQSLDQVKSNYQLVVGLVKQKKFAQAKEKVASLIQQHPDQSVYYTLKALLEVIDKDFVTAEQSLQKAITLNDRNALAYIGLAKLALVEKQYGQAEQYANKALQVSPYLVNVYIILADIALQQQGIDAAEKELLDAYAKVKGNLKAELGILKLLGMVYGDKKQPEKLLLLAEDLVERNKGDSSALSFLAEVQSLDQVKSNYQLVLGLIKENKFAQAKEKLALLIQQNPNQPAYYNLKAVLELIDKDLAAAEQSFQKAIALDDRNVQAYTGLARLALDEKQYDQAKQYANKALQNNQYAVKAYMVLADIAKQQQGVDAAEKVLLDADAKVKGNIKAEVRILKLLGKVYSNKKQSEKLLILAEDLVERNKGNSVALSYLAGIQLLNKDIAGAEQSLRQIITLSPKDAEHRLLLAQLLSKQTGKETEVLKLLDQASENFENPTIVPVFKTAFLIKQNQYQQALEVAKQFDASYPKLSVGKVLKGNVYYAEKKYKEALQSYQLAYQMTPNTKVLDGMLKILTVQNKLKDAIALLENELEKNKDNTQVKFRLASAYQKAGNHDLSIKHYEALLSKQKDNVIVLNNLAWAYSQQKNPKALELAEKAYQKSPKSGVVADTYGYILLKNGNKQESLKVLKQAAVMAPDSAEIQLHLAEAYSANQNKSQAREILQQLVDNNGAEKAAAIKLMEQL